MNRLILLILPVLLFAACKEETEECWKCTYKFTGKQPDRTGDTILCNYTRTDIELREDIEFDATTAGYEKWVISNCEQQ